MVTKLQALTRLVSNRRIILTNFNLVKKSHPRVTLGLMIKFKTTKPGYGREGGEVFRSLIFFSCSDFRWLLSLSLCALNHPLNHPSLSPGSPAPAVSRDRRCRSYFWMMAMRWMMSRRGQWMGEWIVRDGGCWILCGLSWMIDRRWWTG